MKLIITIFAILVSGLLIHAQVNWTKTETPLRRKETEKDIANYIQYLSKYEIFYVDKASGDDNHDGRSPWTQRRGVRGAFGTLVGAIRNIRKNRRSIAIPVKLYIRSGHYKLAKHIRLTARDSNLEILAYPFDNERPVISGATRIWGKDFKPQLFTREEKRIYQYPYSGKCSGHVFINDKRMIRARKPNLYTWTGNNLAGEGPYLVIEDLLLPSQECKRQPVSKYYQNCKSRNKAGFRFRPGDFYANVTNLQDVQVLLFHAWTAERRFVKEITRDRKVLFQKLLRDPVGSRPQPSGWRYIIENSLEELDAVGEFYCDEENKVLYVVPPDENFMSHYVYIGSNAQLFKVSSASNITFNGLELKYTHDKYADWYNSKPSALEIEYSQGIEISNCVIAHIGFNAVMVFNSFRVKIFGNHFYDIGNYAVVMPNTARGANQSPPASQFVEISNNTMSGCGVYHMLQPSCIHARGMWAVRIVGNDISRTPYAGIKVGWQKTFSPDYTDSLNPIFYVVENHVTDYGLAILNDFAGIYISSNIRDCGILQKINRCHLHAVVSRNVIHNGRSFAYGAAGIYSDTAASSITVVNNWIYDLGGASINFHCGQNNSAFNNMIVHVNPFRIFGTCNNALPNGERSKQIFTMQKNVVYVESEKAVMWRGGDWWDFEEPYLNWNVYFGGLTRSKSFFPKSVSFTHWQRQTRNDMDSLIVNPRFADRDERVLTLRQWSPARSLGIQSVDLTDVAHGKSNEWMFHE